MSGDKFSATRIFVFWMQNIVIWCGVFNKIAEHENSIANSSCSSQGVDVVAGVEAIISHLVVKEFQIPCAHAPALLPPPLTRSLSPRSAAEEVSDLPTAVFFHHGISDHRKKKKKNPSESCIKLLLSGGDDFISCGIDDSLIPRRGRSISRGRRRFPPIIQLHPPKITAWFEEDGERRGSLCQDYRDSEPGIVVLRVIFRDALSSLLSFFWIRLVIYPW